jgi:hypothetical protein
MLDIYQDTSITAEQTLVLSRQFEEAAMAYPKAAKGLAWSPYRWMAIHALELSFNALLLHNCLDAKEVRGMQHDLLARLNLATSFGLKLRQRTAQHIAVLTETREYVLHRYVPAKSLTSSQLNRVFATTHEVGKKVEKLLAEKPKRVLPPSA